MSPCTAVIADIVSSRSLSAPRRAEVQAQLVEALSAWSDHPAVLSRFVLTLGDEFQGLVSQASVLPDLQWAVDEAVSPVRLRWGMGHGTLTTPLRAEALGMDGPVWHRARAALDHARDRHLEGGVFRGFSPGDDVVLDGLAHLLQHQRQRWTEVQRSTVSALRSGASQAEIAEARGVSPQAVSAAARAAGWDAWRDGEAALRALLSRYDTPSPRETA